MPALDKQYELLAASTSSKVASIDANGRQIWNANQWQVCMQLGGSF